MNNQRPYVTRWTFHGAARAAEKYLRALENGEEYRLSPRTLTCIARVQQLLLELLLGLERAAAGKSRTAKLPPQQESLARVLKGVLESKLQRQITEEELLEALRTVCAVGNELPLISGRDVLTIAYSPAKLKLYTSFLNAYQARPKDTRGRRTMSQRPTSAKIRLETPSPLPQVRLDGALLLAPIDDPHPARHHEIDERFDYQVEILLERGYHEAIGQTEEEFKDALEPLRKLILAHGAQVNGRVPFLIVPHGSLRLGELMRMVEVIPHGRDKVERTEGRLLLNENEILTLPSLSIPERPYLLLDVAHGAGVRKMPHETYLRLLRSHGRSPLTAQETMLYLIQHETKLDFYKFLVAGSRYKSIYHPYVLYSGCLKRPAPPCAEMSFITAEAAERWLAAPEDWEQHVSDRITRTAELSRAIPSCAGRISSNKS